ncbi:transketolase family protein [bacterium]
MTIKSLRREYGEYISELAKTDNRIIALEGDLGEATQSVIFKNKNPKRHIEMGIAEQNMAGVAAGMAACGKIPIVHSFACFVSMRSCEQIRTSICYPNLNVKFLVTHGGVSAGSAGTTHHALEDLAIMRSLPNMTVLVPGDVNEMKRVIDASLSYKGPVYIRLAKEDVEDIFDETYKFNIGEAYTPVDGNDGAIITTGTMLGLGLEASSILRNEYNLSIRVIHCASVKPIDKEVIKKAAQETKNIVTVEEHSIIGGLGGAVSEIVAETGNARVKRVGILDRFCGVGSAPYLMEQEGLTVDNIISFMLTLKECAPINSI